VRIYLVGKARIASTLFVDEAASCDRCAHPCAQRSTNKVLAILADRVVAYNFGSSSYFSRVVAYNFGSFFSYVFLMLWLLRRIFFLCFSFVFVNVVGLF